MLREPSVPVLPVINLFTVLTPNADLRTAVAGGKATEFRRWCTFHSRRNCLVLWATNSGPPSVESSSGMSSIGGKRVSESVDETLCSSFGSLNYGPVRVAIDNYQVRVTLVVKVVRTDALKWV